MTTAATFNFWQEEWLLYEKVEFDGIRREIVIHPDADTLTVRSDIYSAWKRWVRLHNNAGYAPAIRVIGGDPVGGGQFAGDIYFLQNDWKMVVGHFVEMDGILYSDDGSSPYKILAGGGVRATVSSLTQAINTGGGGSTDVSAIWEAQHFTNQTAGSFGAAIRDLFLRLPEVQTALAAVQNTANTVSSNVTLVSGKVDTVEADVATVDGKLDTLSGEVSGVDGKVDAIASDITNLDGKVDGIDNEPVLTAIGSVDTKVDGLDAKVIALGTDLETVGSDVAAVQTSLTDVAGDVGSLQTDVTSVLGNLAEATALINTLLKYETNRTRVDGTNKTLTVYDDDGVTPLRVFSLRNFVGLPSTSEIAERNPI